MLINCRKAIAVYRQTLVTNNVKVCKRDKRMYDFQQMFNYCDLMKAFDVFFRNLLCPKCLKYQFFKEQVTNSRSSKSLRTSKLPKFGPFCKIEQEIAKSKYILHI